jgi:hypothetical protein
MHARTRRKKRTTSMEATTGERDADEEEDDEIDRQLDKLRQFHHQQRDLTTTPRNPVAPASLSSLASKNLELIFLRKTRLSVCFYIVFLRRFLPASVRGVRFFPIFKKHDFSICPKTILGCSELKLSKKNIYIK